MEPLFGLFLVYIVYLGALMSPGPDFLIVVRHSLGLSTRSGLFAALGVASGQAVHIAYSFAGIGLLISQSLLLFSLIKWIGAAYLIYIGYKALRSKGLQAEVLQRDTLIKSASAKDNSARTAYISGFVANILNPKATLFFVALFSQMIDPSLSLQMQMGFALICIATALIWFSLVSLVMGVAPVRRKYAQISQRIDQIFGAFFVILGLKLAFSK